MMLGPIPLRALGELRSTNSSLSTVRPWFPIPADTRTPDATRVVICVEHAAAMKPVDCAQGE